MTRALPASAAGLALAVGLAVSAVGPSFGQEPDLAAYFGFDGLEVVKIGRRAGPMLCTDVDGDGLTDLLVVNNQASRLELRYQRRDADPDAPVDAPRRVNEFPEHWRFDRGDVNLTHPASTFVVHDFDGDGRKDVIYAGAPNEIVFVRQTAPRTFRVARRHRVKDLSPSRDGLAVADVVGDGRPELIAIVNGKITIWPLDGDSLGPSLTLAAGSGIVAFVLEDYDGDGRPDIAGVIPDDPAPVRIWFGDVEDGLGAIGAQIRFEMPPVLEVTAVRLPAVPAARVAVIEKASRRIVLYAVAVERIDERGDRDAPIRGHGFTDAGNRQRDHAVVDADGDGRLDLVATDTEANAVVAYLQRPEEGLSRGEPFPSLSEITDLVAGNVDDDPQAELFVLSPKEGVVGRSDVTSGEIPFPVPVNISAGHTPTALNLVELERGWRVAVVAKAGRDYVVDLVDMDGAVDTIDIGKLSKSPETIVALDADQDGRTDLLLFTRDKPMTMLRAGPDGFTLMESKDMGQFGLVQAARADNIAVFDMDGDGRSELLVADKNYVRAVRYDAEPRPGVSPGWQVVTQVNARKSTSDLVSLAILGGRIVAADKANESLVIMAADERGRWSEVEALTVRGFSFGSIHAGSFSRGGREDILAIGDDGFAVIQLAGERITLDEVASWRSADEKHVEHELAAGDVNGDGFLDMIALDAGEQMCEIFTFTETGRMLYATGFRTFESQVFSGGDGREFEPSAALVADVTGDGADDLLLLAHDRVLIYPQMTAR